MLEAGRQAELLREPAFQNPGGGLPMLFRGLLDQGQRADDRGGLGLF